VDFGDGETVDLSNSVTRREAEPKGFFRADLVSDGGRWRLAGAPAFRGVNARRFVTLRVGELAAGDPVRHLEERLEKARSTGVDLADAFVRVVGSVDAPDRARVTASVARALIAGAYEVLLVLEAREASVARDPRFAIRMSEIEALEQYVGSREDWAADRDELLRLGRELVDEVLE
jgi:hypothetical protein